MTQQRHEYNEGYKWAWEELKVGRLSSNELRELVEDVAPGVCNFKLGFLAALEDWEAPVHNPDINGSAEAEL